MMISDEPTYSAHIEPLEAEALRDVEDIIDISKQASGYIPTSLRIMAYKPNILRAFSGLIGAIMRTESDLSQDLKWLAAHAVSTAAGCRYCQAHTASNSSKSGLPIKKIHELLLYETSDAFDPSDRALVAFCLAAGETPNSVNEDHFRKLHEFFNKGQIVEIVSVISLFGWLNRWNDTFASDLEEAPLKFANRHLTERGWVAGKHAKK
ncbi:MAG: fusion protein [Rhodospirillaceae bacterium]|nr:fusion protein [Rhodospirillaceae bacterium]|tara:strand:+ start:1526 stop:2149 length:624 start_codon:yes stop_codon:yes gene_type:complete